MTLHLELKADYEAARVLGPWLGHALDELGTMVSRAGEIELALHELACNIIDHAYDDDTREGATYHIDLSRHGDNVHADFRDRGKPFVDTRVPKNGEPTIRGYGLIIVEQLAASIHYERNDDENHWTLVFAPQNP